MFITQLVKRFDAAECGVLWDVIDSTLFLIASLGLFFLSVPHKWGFPQESVQLFSFFFLSFYWPRSPTHSFSFFFSFSQIIKKIEIQFMYHEIHLLKMYAWVVFSILHNNLGNNHCHLIPEYSSPQRETSCALIATTLFPFP